MSAEQKYRDIDMVANPLQRNFFPFFLYSSITILICFIVINTYSGQRLIEVSIKIDSLQNELVSLKKQTEKNLFYSELNFTVDSNFHEIYKLPPRYENNNKVEMWYFEYFGNRAKDICILDLLSSRLGEPNISYSQDSLMTIFINNRIEIKDKRILCRTCYENQKQLVDSLMNTSQ